MYVPSPKHLAGSAVERDISIWKFKIADSKMAAEISSYLFSWVIEVANFEYDKILEIQNDGFKNGGHNQSKAHLMPT